MRSLILPVLTFLGTAVVAEDSNINPPFKFRANKKLFTAMINSGDHNVVEIFQDLQVGSLSEGDLNLENVSFSMEPTTGELLDFDLDTTFNQESIAVHSDNLSFKGTGKIGEQDITIHAPISRTAIEFLSKGT